MRALVVSNMLADQAHPERGSFVRDQVSALRALDGLDVELLEFPPGARALARAPLQARRLPGAPRRVGPRRGRYDVVHAHFGLTAWPAMTIPARVRALTLHGTDLRHPRTRIATVAVLPAIDLLAGVSGWLNSQLPRWARARAQVLPCGVDVERFHPIARADARARLGLDPASPYVLFPADPARPEKRFDRARQLCDAVGARLLALGAVSPDSVPLWVNAADAVVVPSEREGFGLAVLEALACEVPVLATPVGIHAEALSGVEGSLCAPFDLSRWREALQAHLSPPPPVPDDSSREAPGGVSRGPDAPQARASAMRFSAQRMAQRVADAWHAALRHAG